MTRLSVVMPTYNRAALLERTVNQLFETQRSFADWELLVVDDGSTDATPRMLERLAHRWPLRWQSQANRGPGAGRNAAVAQAQGELLVFIGDDIFVSPHFLTAHWAAYRQAPRREHHGAIGWLEWHPEIPMTPFRRWIHTQGLQFGYGCLPPTSPLPFAFFHTANGAVSRAAWDAGGPFREDLGEYGWEDVELAYRYQQQGLMELQLVAVARGHHHHLIDLRHASRRRRLTGQAARRLLRVQPTLAEFLKAPFYARHRAWLRHVGRVTPLLDGVMALLDYWDRHHRAVPIPLIRRLLWCYYFAGFAEEPAP